MAALCFAWTATWVQKTIHRLRPVCHMTKLQMKVTWLGWKDDGRKVTWPNPWVGKWNTGMGRENFSWLVERWGSLEPWPQSVMSENLPLVQHVTSLGRFQYNLMIIYMSWVFRNNTASTSWVPLYFFDTQDCWNFQEHRCKWVNWNVQTESCVTAQPFFLTVGIDSSCHASRPSPEWRLTHFCSTLHFSQRAYVSILIRFAFW